MRPQLTIGMPLFNDSVYVQETIESIICQSFENFQLIIFDDCSTDDSLSLVNQLASRDSRITVHKNEQNLGNLKNFLKLIEYGDTEYFCWIGSHDLVERSYYKILIDELNINKDKNYAYGHCVFIDEFGVRLSRSPNFDLMKVQLTPDPLKNFFMSIGRARSWEVHFHGVYRSRILNGFGNRHKKAYVGWDHVVSSLGFYSGVIYNDNAEFKARVFNRRTSDTYSRLIGTNSRRIKYQPTFISLVKSYIIEYWNLPESRIVKILNFSSLIKSLRKGYEIRFMRNLYWEIVSFLKFLSSLFKILIFNILKKFVS